MPRIGNMESRGQFKFDTGTEGTPSIGFLQDPDTGIYADTADTLSFTSAGTRRFSLLPDGSIEIVGITAPGVTTDKLYNDNGDLHWNGINISQPGVSWPLLAPDGSVGAPSYSFANSTTTGLYSNTTNQVSISANGSQVAVFTDAAVQFPVDVHLQDGSLTDNLSLAFTSDPNTGLYRPAADTLGFVTQGVERAVFRPTGEFGTRDGSGASGQALTIQTGSGASGYSGGAISINAGAGGTQSGGYTYGGNISIQAGAGGASTNAYTYAGNVTVQAGDGGTAGSAYTYAGNVTIQSGNAGSGTYATYAGKITLQAGNAGSPSGGYDSASGNIEIYAGSAGNPTGGGSSDGGRVDIRGGSGFGGGYVSTSYGGIVGIYGGGGNAGSGRVVIIGGFGASTGAAGEVNIYGGASQFVTGADSTVSAAAAVIKGGVGGQSVDGTAGDGGDVKIYGGTSGVATGTGTGGAGGDVIIQPGLGQDTPTPVHGTINLTHPLNTETAELRFYEATLSGTEYVGFKAPADIDAASTGDGDSVVWTLPEGDGTSGQVIQTNGSGVLSWVTVAGAGALLNVVEDTTPQLGGNLDLNGYNIITADSSSSNTNDILIKTGDASTGSYTAGNITIQGGSGFGTANPAAGGDVKIYGGYAATGTEGGDIRIKAGDNASGYSSGDVTIQSGIKVGGPWTANSLSLQANNGVSLQGGTASGNFDGVNVTMRGGSADGAGYKAGDVEVRGGYASGNASGGDVLIEPGRKSGSGTNGEIRLLDDGTSGINEWQGQTLRVRVGTIENGGSDAPNLEIRGSDAYATSGQGGAVSLVAGNAIAADTGGGINLTAGQGGATGTGGDTKIYAGAGGATSGNGGALIMAAGDGTNSGNAGNVTINGGDGGSSAGDGGAVTIEGGSPTAATANNGGSVFVKSGAGSTNNGSSPGSVYLQGVDAGVGSNSQGGEIIVTSGDGQGIGLGGDISFTTGIGGPSQRSGNFDVTTGDAASSQAGAINLTTGNSSNSFSGDIKLETGTALSNGGDIELVLGAGTNNGNVLIQSSAASTFLRPAVRFYEATTNGSNYIGLQAPANITANRTWVLPQDDPSSVDGYFMTTNSSGVLSFALGLKNPMTANLDVGGYKIVSTGTDDIVIQPDLVTGNGNATKIYGGNSTTTLGGNVEITGGRDTGTNYYGGYVGVGAATSSAPGTVSIYGGESDVGGDAHGGAVTVKGGDTAGSAKNGGAVVVQGGTSSASGDGGSVILRAGGGNTNDGHILAENNSAAGAAVEVRFEEGATGTEYIGLKAPDSVATSRTWVLPEDDPASAAGKLLTTDTSGVMSFTTASAAAQPVMYEFTATAGQTTFSGTDDNTRTLSYTVGGILVFKNGSLLDPDDYTATNGTSVVLNVGASLNDEVNIQTYVGVDSFGTQRTFKYVVDTGTTTLSGADDNGVTLNYPVGMLSVFMNGAKLSEDEYTATDGSSVVLDTAVGSDDTVFEILTFAQFTAAEILSENLIINGNMEVWQRGTSFTTADNFTADRWLYDSGSSADVTVARSSITLDGSKYGLGVTVTTADASIAASEYEIVRQAVEGNNMRPAMFGTADARAITLSFWVKSSLTGTYCISFRGVSATRSYIAEYTVDTADTWEKKEITIPGDTTGAWITDNGPGLNVMFTLSCGTTFQTTADAWTAGNYLATSNQVNFVGTLSNVFEVTQVQLEVAGNASPFKHRSIGEEIRLCQRYYCKTFDIGTTPAQNLGVNGSLVNESDASGFVSAVFTYPVEMRSTPTITTYNPSAANGNWSNGSIPVSNPGTSRCPIRSNSSGTGTAWGYIHVTAEAEL